MAPAVRRSLRAAAKQRPQDTHHAKRAELSARFCYFSAQLRPAIELEILDANAMLAWRDRRLEHARFVDGPILDDLHVVHEDANAVVADRAQGVRALRKIHVTHRHHADAFARPAFDFG